MMIMAMISRRQNQNVQRGVSDDGLGIDHMEGIRGLSSSSTMTLELHAAYGGLQVAQDVEMTAYFRRSGLLDVFDENFLLIVREGSC